MNVIVKLPVDHIDASKISDVIGIFTRYYYEGLCDDHVRKPASWALYQTWKVFDAKESSKEREKK